MLARGGTVLVDGRSQPKGMRLRGGEQICLPADATSDHPIPQPDLSLPLIATTSDLVVINKPPGLAVHPLRPGEMGTVANALVARYPECVAASLPNPREAGLVHRLDRSTSGVLVAARKQAVYHDLRALFASGRVQKHYVALVHGRVEAADCIDLSLAPMPGDRQRMRTLARDRAVDCALPARTDYEPLAVSRDLSLVRIRCTSGRRHQVRVHFAAIGHPLVGDTLYGGQLRPGIPSALLHATCLQWPNQRYDAPLPETRAHVLRELFGDLWHTLRLGP